MFKRLLFITMIVAFGCAQTIFAQEEDAFQAFASNAAPEKLKNPFVPKLPIKEEPVIVEAEPEIDKEAEGPDSGAIPITGPLVEKEPELVIVGVPNLIVTGLIWNSDRPQAIVNGNIIEIGDRIFGVPTDAGETIPELKFVGINKKGLLVSYLDKTITISPTKETKKERKK